MTEKPEMQNVRRSTRCSGSERRKHRLTGPADEQTKQQRKENDEAEFGWQIAQAAEAQAGAVVISVIRFDVYKYMKGGGVQLLYERGIDGYLAIRYSGWSIQVGPAQLDSKHNDTREGMRTQTQQLRTNGHALTHSHTKEIGGWLFDFCLDFNLGVSA